MKHFCIFSLILLAIPGASQDLASLPDKEKAEHTTKQLFLIDDLQLRNETIQILNQLYNYKFDDAGRKIQKIKQKFPWHPMGYLCWRLLSGGKFFLI